MALCWESLRLARALARAFERLGEVAEARHFLQRAEAAALHPADARREARHAQPLLDSVPGPR